jgi:SAM-dependent methyltransferase
MGNLNGEELSLGQYYDGPGFDVEVRRWQEYPVEAAIIRRWIDRFAEAGSIVVKAGVGGGFHAEYLARKGCKMYLVDVSARLLEYVSCKLKMNGLGDSLAGCVQASAGKVEAIPEGAADLVLFLGPLHNLRSGGDRSCVLAEAARVLRPGGALLATGVNRLTYFRDLLRFERGAVTERAVFHEAFFRDGNLDPQRPPRTGCVHMTSAAEFRAQFAGRFEETAFVGVESFAAGWQACLKDLPAEQTAAWLDLVERTGATPEGIAASDHFLFAGRKR